VQGNQKRANLGVGALSREQFGHHGASFFPRKRLAMISNTV